VDVVLHSVEEAPVTGQLGERRLGVIVELAVVLELAKERL